MPAAQDDTERDGERLHIKMGGEILPGYKQKKEEQHYEQHARIEDRGSSSQP